MNDAAADATDVLSRLSTLCRSRDLDSLAARLTDLAQLVDADMANVEREIVDAATPKTDYAKERIVGKGAAHLVLSGGKRLRPMCVVLASKLRGELSEAALQLGVSVELVHNATLLHDDVVDLGDARRGKPTSRALYGNSASIYAGDWLLVEALRRVRRWGDAETLVRLLDVIEEMIFAESLQLENRGRLVLDENVWKKVAEGKTAALFRWAMYAGARAAGLAANEVEALERYGLHLGIAFQAVDDVLDFDGDPLATGKTLFADLREGKTTYPLILAARRDADLADRLAKNAGEGDDAFAREVLDALHRTGALDEARAFANDQVDKAAQALSILPSGAARDALATVLETTIARRG